MGRQKTTTKDIGNAGENRAAVYLEQQGFAILKRNWRTRYGEIDIIAYKEGVLVFVEVKTLPSGDARTLEHELNAKKQEKITKTAKWFILQNRQYNSCIIRFDVIVVDMPGWESIHHIESAFTEFV